MESTRISSGICSLDALIRCAINKDLPSSLEVKIPVKNADEQTAADDISDERRNDTFPDVQAYGNLGCVLPDAHGNKEHIRNYVVETKRDESESRPPDSNDLADVVPTAHAQIAS